MGLPSHNFLADYLKVLKKERSKSFRNNHWPGFQPVRFEEVIMILGVYRIPAENLLDHRGNILDSLQDFPLSGHISE